MADYYADSSALVKRHVREAGTDWLHTLTNPAAGNTIIMVQISIVEVVSALNRRVREGLFDLADYAQVLADFMALCAVEYQVIDLTATIVNRACTLLERHPLRAYDAVQLATALMANEALLAAALPPLVLLSADDRLLVAAQAEGLPTDNPNQYA